MALKILCFATGEFFQTCFMLFNRFFQTVLSYVKIFTKYSCKVYKNSTRKLPKKAFKKCKKFILPFGSTQLR